MASPQDPLLKEEEEAMEDHSDMDVEKGDIPERQNLPSLRVMSTARSIITVVILAFVNLLIYANRSSVAGVLPYIQKAYDTNASLSGLLNTLFIGSYVLVAPIAGYLGDHCNKKYTVCAGVIVWLSMTLTLSFIPDGYFLLFLLTSGLVGAGEATFCTIAPSIIADLFTSDQRTRMLNVFYSVIPVGCGLGYIIGPKVTDAARGDWHWAFRVTPGLGLIAVALMILVTKELPRTTTNGKKNNKSQKFAKWATDLKKLFKNRSFMLTTMGSTAVSFIVGAIGVWGPSYLTHARTLLQEKDPCRAEPCDYHDILIFGVVTVVSGILGVVAGTEISKRYRKSNPRADPLVCGCAMMLSAPFLLLALTFGNISLVATNIFIFIGETLLSVNFTLISDIILKVVTPWRRSSALAVQMTIYHLLGDAGSPYLIGLISDTYERGYAKSPLLKYRSLEYALMTCTIMAVIGGAFFMATALYIERDEKEAEMESEPPSSSSSSLLPADEDRASD
ncbi:protein spinster homolog 1-like [Hyla sarda]|uniref:protein spinster homolog 1-like n=1 Tax=Hyla sarda TaxID=327740 RepID=UPI0024C36D58|nr:protein spinster homolog 1-like [Hyla sarda]